VLAADRYLQPNHTFKHCSVGKAYKYYTTSPFSTCLESAIRGHRAMHVWDPVAMTLVYRHCWTVMKIFFKTKISQSMVNLKQLDLHELSLNCLPWYEEDISQYELYKWPTIRIQLNLITLSQSLWRDEDIWQSDSASVSTVKNISGYRLLQLKLKACSDSTMFRYIDGHSTHLQLDGPSYNLSIMHAHTQRSHSSWSWRKCQFNHHGLVLLSLSWSCHRPCSTFHLEHYRQKLKTQLYTYSQWCSYTKAHKGLGPGNFLAIHSFDLWLVIAYFQIQN